MTTTPAPVLAVVGAAGGIGTSTIAASIARTAARYPGYPVVLIDAHQLSGGIDLVLGMEDTPGYRWPAVERQAVSEPAALDGLWDRLPADDNPNLRVLSTSRNSDTGTGTPAGSVLATVISRLRAEGIMVVVDLPREELFSYSPGSEVPTVTSLADEIIVVSTFQVRPSAAASSLTRWLCSNELPHSLVLRHRDWSGMTAEEVSYVVSIQPICEVGTLPRLARTMEIAGLPQQLPQALSHVSTKVLDRLHARV